MVKQGPCCHCGITNTPLWRNGPPEKPVLCNACGSRWRTKGTLANYMPMHSGGYAIRIDSSDKLSRGKKSSQKSNEQRSHMRKEPCNGHADFEFGFQRPDYYIFKGFDEDASTKSSTGSGISYSEGCAQHMTGFENFSVHGSLWDCPVPSKKRTPMSRRCPSRAKLARMQSFLYIPETSLLTYSSEEDLLVDYKPPSMATEIGLGGVFIRPPLSMQESESSSFMVESRVHGHTQALKHELSMVHAPYAQILKGTSKPVPNCDTVKQVLRNMEGGHEPALLDNGCVQNKGFLENFPYKCVVLQSCRSPLALSDLKDIFNFDTFTGLLTDQEQCHLMKYVSSADVSRKPESLKEMFNSTQFESARANFQLLLSEGMFDSSNSGLSPKLLQLYQQLLVLTDLTTSGWMERCSHILNHGKCKDSLDFVKAVEDKEIENGANVADLTLPSVSAGLASVKSQPGRPVGQFMTGAEESSSFGSSSHVIQSSPTSNRIHSLRSEEWQRNNVGSRERGSCSRYCNIKAAGKCGWSSSSKSCYLSTSDIGSSGQYDSTDALADEPDLLLHVPSSMSFQQAELLQQPAWNKPQPLKEPEIEIDNHDFKSTDSLIVSSTWSIEENLDFSGLLRNNSLPAGLGHLLPNGALLLPGKMPL